MTAVEVAPGPLMAHISKESVSWMAINTSLQVLCLVEHPIGTLMVHGAHMAHSGSRMAMVRSGGRFPLGIHVVSIDNGTPVVHGAHVARSGSRMAMAQLGGIFTLGTYAVSIDNGTPVVHGAHVARSGSRTVSLQQRKSW